MTFRKKLFANIEALQHVLDSWIKYYNEERVPTRAKCAVVEDP
jgi:hypothetical protein